MRTITDELVPLHSQDAEMCALGSMLYGSRYAEEVFLLLQDEDFYRPAHREIYKAMRQLQRETKAIDLVTLKQELIRRDTYDDVGGEEYLIRIMEFVPSPANAEHYAKLILEAATLRKLEDAGHEIVKVVRDAEKTTDEKVNSAEQIVYEIGAKRIGKDFMQMQSLARTVMSEIDDVIERGEPTRGVLSGFVDLDHLTTGFYPGDLVIVAARPAMGKTSLVLKMGLNVAAKGGSVAVFSLEMSGMQLTRRLVSMISRVQQNVMKNAGLDEPVLRKLADACETLYSMPLYIDESSDISALDMMAKCRRINQDNNLQLIIVDYLQLMRGHRKSENRVNEVSDIARALKMMAKELKVPVVALSQLSRGVESRDNKRPQLSDLRESGSIEAEADMVMFIYRDQYYKDRDKTPDDFEETPRDQFEKAEIIIGKNRNGPTQTVELGFAPSFTLFENLRR